MAFTSLTLGPVHTLVQNQVYALPSRACYIHSNAALVVSNTEDFAVTQAIAASVPTLVAASFVKCTVSAAIVTVKSLG